MTKAPPRDAEVTGGLFYFMSKSNGGERKRARRSLAIPRFERFG
jgi:hypothetical protein